MSAAEAGPDKTPLAHYKIGREIGAGSFAKVYLGSINARPNAAVAIKSVLRSKLTKKLLENLESEISILKGIKHRHIVQLLDITDTGSYIHLVMEYCPLGDLSYFIKKRDKLSQENQAPLLRDIARRYPNTLGAGLHDSLVRHFLKQLASALEFLRSKNLMHRDVKPQNLLLKPPLLEASPQSIIGLPDLPVLKLADFGFARYLQTASMAETLCGSPLYMAPEILRYEKYDATADLWSVGTVLYEMLVGKPPFRAQNHVELLRKIDKNDDVIKFPSEVPLDAGIQELIRALLKRNPRQRMTFEAFFTHPVVCEPMIPIQAYSIHVEGGRDSSAASERSQPLLMPTRQPRQDGTHISIPSPAFITDLIPVNTPPVESIGMQPLTVTKRPEDQAIGEQRPDPSPRSAFARRESHSANGANLPRSLGQRAASPLERRISQRGQTDVVVPVGSRRSSHSSDQERARHVAAASSWKQPQGPSYGSSYGSQLERERQGYTAGGGYSHSPSEAETEYVVIEKKSVEVNAMADALAYGQQQHQQGLRRMYSHSPRQHQQPVHRSPSSSSSHSLSAMQVQQQANHATVQALAIAERRLGSSPTSAITKALSIAGQRLFGGGSPPAWLETMVHHGRRLPYAGSKAGGYAQSLMRQGATLYRGDQLGLWHGSDEALSGEEEKVLQEIQAIAAKSAVVYEFAELKLGQLIPPPTSSSRSSELAVDASLLTNEAIVSLCEEAMVLYLKSLALQQMIIDTVQRFMSSENFPGAGPKLTAVVSWTRERYNEVLEKAEYLERKKRTTLQLARPDHPFEDISAERLLYDRALELSRGAAVCEMAGEDLGQCEGDYEMSVLMLEAILETGSSGVQEGGMEQDDREAIERWVGLTRKRLDMLRRKLDALGNGAPAG
ncbi:kinase-like domain-containing protein [Protomyces lactucae-debilis]|uniref:non-specific serine/threonine protein kinase n=1 Tax=Protomyces lactucae-debilis TaxID=2754530 RepID=A0A1Y2FWQ4_PROLT|nr:kinase-like domain-containing protein [Protomyces lactucae-debilis]ORY87616.1 kinase-like domain-containing protein [Protomyces lactucae-debilis]